jgi:putative transposase
MQHTSSEVGASLHNHFNSARHLVDRQTVKPSNRQTFKLRRSAALAKWQALAT